MASLLAALKAIPDLVGLVKDLIGVVNNLVESYKKAQTDKWINEGKELARKIAVAKTDAERAELVKKLSDAWNNQP